MSAALATRKAEKYPSFMKVLFREQDVTRLNYFQGLLEAEGISAFVRNEDSTMIMPSVTVARYFPALCVMNDSDYDAAMEVLRKYVKDDEVLSQQEVPCPKCGESNPANFDVCWMCEAPLKG